jgi:hypothetical protein
MGHHLVSTTLPSLSSCGTKKAVVTDFINHPHSTIFAGIATIPMIGLYIYINIIYYRSTMVYWLSQSHLKLYPFPLSSQLSPVPNRRSGDQQHGGFYHGPPRREVIISLYPDPIFFGGTMNEKIMGTYGKTWENMGKHGNNGLRLLKWQNMGF